MVHCTAANQCPKIHYFVSRYSQSDRLPEPIKDKLSRLPVIIENLAATPKIS